MLTKTSHNARFAQGDVQARGNARDDSSPLTTRVKDARLVHELCCELCHHIVELTLTKQELQDVMAELIEVANLYGFQSGEPDESTDDVELPGGGGS